MCVPDRRTGIQSGTDGCSVLKASGDTGRDQHKPPVREQPILNPAGLRDDRFRDNGRHHCQRLRAHDQVWHRLRHELHVIERTKRGPSHHKIISGPVRHPQPDDGRPGHSGPLENYQRKDYAIITLSTGPEVFEKNIKVLDWTTLHKLATEVETWATKEGVKLVVKQAYSQLPINSVISQSIPADTLIAKNDTLTITVSKGVSVLVPDFKTMNMTDAQTEITALNLLENVDVSLIKMYNDTNIYGSYIWQDVNAGTKIESSLEKKFEMRVYYSLGKPFIESQVGSLESSLTNYFYTLNLNSANLTYSVTYSNCGSGYDRGEICSMSKFNEYVSVGTHIDIVVHQ